jgi:hypothetical protein
MGILMKHRHATFVKHDKLVFIAFLSMKNPKRSFVPLKNRCPNLALGNGISWFRLQYRVSPRYTKENILDGSNHFQSKHLVCYCERKRGKQSNFSTWSAFETKTIYQLKIHGRGNTNKLACFIIQKNII